MTTLSALFTGRLGRAHFAWSLLAFLAIAIAVNIVVFAFELLGDAVGALANVLSFVAFILIAITAFGVAARRYHDMDWSGWFVLLHLIPIVNVVMLLILLFKTGTAGANRFGAPLPKEVPLKEAILNKAHAAAPAASAPVQAAPTQPASPDPVVAAQPAAPAEEQPKTDLV